MTQEIAAENDKYMEATKNVVSAYIGNNSYPANSLPDLIKSVYETFASLSPEPQEEAAPPVPAVSIKKSVTPDYIICLENGKRFKSLKRHLKANYNMTPEEYREKWGLPGDYPMVAPNYTKRRSELAKDMGLGQGPRSAFCKGERPPQQSQGGVMREKMRLV